MIFLSSCAWPPSMTSSISLPSCRAMSRNSRGKRLNSAESGSMRTRLIESCSSPDTRVMRSVSSLKPVARCRISSWRRATRSPISRKTQGSPPRPERRRTAVQTSCNCSIWCSITRISARRSSNLMRVTRISPIWFIRSSSFWVVTRMVSSICRTPASGAAAPKSSAAWPTVPASAADGPRRATGAAAMDGVAGGAATCTAVNAAGAAASGLPEPDARTERRRSSRSSTAGDGDPGFSSQTVVNVEMSSSAANIASKT